MHRLEQIFIELKLSPDISIPDFRVWMERISRDVLCHAAFAFVVHKVRFFFLVQFVFVSNL